MTSSSFVQTLLFAAVLAVPHVYAACPSGTIQGLSPNDCFILQPTALTWSDAEQGCFGAGGHLVSVSSRLTNSFLVSKVLAQSCDASKYWLGGSYGLLQNGRWTWSDGQRFSYTNWASGQPPTDVPTAHCLSVDLKTGQWYGQPCGDFHPSLCRVPPLGATATTTTPVPSPTKCPAGWTYIAQTKKCYQIPLGYTSWNQGLAKCKSLNGTLASIPSAAANAALYEFASKTDANAAKHIGLYGGIGKWKWTDGTPVDYTNWKAHEPRRGAGDCVEFYDSRRNDADEWYNIDCDATGHPLLPLCQRDPLF